MQDLRVGKKRDDQFRNHEIAVYAAFLLGGASRPVDTEDLAVKLNEIAPGRFVWSKYAEQINLELVRVAASDAKKLENGGLMRGSGRQGWQLTEAGKRWVRNNGALLSGGHASQPRSMSREARYKRAERVRLLGTEAYRKATSGSLDGVTQREAEAFFRIDPYVDQPKREQRILQILNAFGKDPHLGDVVRQLAERVSQ